MTALLFPFLLFFLFPSEMASPRSSAVPAFHTCAKIMPDSTAYLEAALQENGTVRVKVNGWLLTDGACHASLAIGCEKQDPQGWETISGYAVQMDCGPSSLFYDHEVIEFGFLSWLSTHPFRNRNIPLTAAYYRLVVRTVDQQGSSVLYSEPFYFNPSP